MVTECTEVFSFFLFTHASATKLLQTALCLWGKNLSKCESALTVVKLVPEKKQQKKTPHCIVLRLAHM